MIVDRVSAALAAGLIVSTLTGCEIGGGSTNASCDHGRATVRQALDDFLAAAQEGDRARAEGVLDPAATFVDAEWAALGDALAGTDLDEITVSTEQMGSAHSAMVALPSGAALGDFEIHELEDASGCFGVAWGDYPPAEPGSSESASQP